MGQPDAGDDKCRRQSPASWRGSLCRLLNPASAAHVPAYASLLRCVEPDLIARVSAQAVGRGYRHIKLHETTVATAQAAREAIGDVVALMFDANCPWSVDQALSVADALRPFRLLWLEEPVWPPEDYAALATVRQRGGIPVAAGENAGGILDLAHMLSAGAVDHIQPSVIKMGGVSAVVKICGLTRAHGLSVAPHSPYFGPGLLATMHLCAACPEIGMVERYYCDLEESPLGATINPVDGRLAVPDGPGLGVDPDPAVIARCRIARLARHLLRNCHFITCSSFAEYLRMPIYPRHHKMIAPQRIILSICHPRQSCAHGLPC